MRCAPRGKSSKSVFEVSVGGIKNLICYFTSQILLVDRRLANLARVKLGNDGSEAPPEHLGGTCWQRWSDSCSLAGSWLV